MKKYFINLFIIFVLLFTGCGNSKNNNQKEDESSIPSQISAKDIVLNASNKVDALDNYRSKMNMNMVAGDDDFNFTITMESIGEYDEKNDTAKVITTSNVSENEMEEISYITKNDTSQTTYTKGDDDKWYKKTEENTSDFDFLNKMTDVTEVTSETSNRKFKLTLTKEALMDLLGDSFEEENIQIDVDKTEFYIYVSADGYISNVNITMPLTLLIEGLSIESNCKIEMLITDLNAIDDVIIPQDILDSAIESKD